MPEPIIQSYEIMQIMQIMNQLHRLSMRGECDTRINGMSVPQLACIGYLAYHGGQPVYQRDLETCFKLRRSTISSLLTTLERKDLIRRIPVSHDARLKQLALTEAGRQLGDHVMDHFTGLSRLLVADLDREERESLHHILEKVSKSLAGRCP